LWVLGTVGRNVGTFFLVFPYFPTFLPARDRKRILILIFFSKIKNENVGIMDDDSIPCVFSPPRFLFMERVFGSLRGGKE
jgi:hypothetical protein